MIDMLGMSAAFIPAVGSTERNATGVKSYSIRSTGGDHYTVTEHSTMLSA